MIFTNSTIKSDLNIYINNVGIDRVQVTKFLGVVIDEKLNWKEHVSYIPKKLSKTTAVLRKASQVLNERACYILYCSIFLPYINYCSEIWEIFTNQTSMPYI